MKLTSLFLLLVSTTLGEEIKIPDLTINVKSTGETIVYKDVVIRKIEADGIRIKHDSGFTTIPYEKIPPELRQQLGMDPVKAVMARQERADNDYLFRRELIKFTALQAKEVEKITPVKCVGTVAQVFSDGVLSKGDTIIDLGVNEDQVFFTGHPNQNSLVEGDLLFVWALPQGNFSYTTKDGEQKTVKKMQITKEVSIEKPAGVFLAAEKGTSLFDTYIKPLPEQSPSALTLPGLHPNGLYTGGLHPNGQFSGGLHPNGLYNIGLHPVR